MHDEFSPKHRQNIPVRTNFEFVPPSRHLERKWRCGRTFGRNPGALYVCGRPFEHLGHHVSANLSADALRGL